MPSHPVASESILTRDASKRKRVNRSAKLKQCKLDARREQWLSQGKQQAPTLVIDQDFSSKSRDSACQSPKVSADEDFCHTGSTTGDSDAESCVINQDDLCDGKLKGLCNCNSVSNCNSCSSRKGEKDFVHGSPVQVPVVLNPADKKMGNKGKRRSVRVKCKLESYDGDSEHSNNWQKGTDGNLVQDEDDWEAAADALSSQINLNKEPLESTADKSVMPKSARDNPGLEAGILKPEYKINSSAAAGGRARGIHRAAAVAWRPEDTCRPATLPRLPKQQQPMSRKPILSGWGSIQRDTSPVIPPCCPICTEELDSTDSSFLPCSCGFRLCLFCHHRIAAEDGRCPGCRKAYKSEYMKQPLRVVAATAGLRA